MTTTDAIKILANFNKWRRGAEIPQPSPALIGEAIDVACAALTFERTWIEGGMNPEDAPPLPWMKPFEAPENSGVLRFANGGEPAVETDAEYVVNEPIESKISRATPTWAGKDAEEHLREIRGEDAEIVELGVLKVSGEYLLGRGFKPLRHLILNKAFTIDIGRRRQLGVSGLGSPNEMIFLSKIEDEKVLDSICIHNYDYDGFLTQEKIDRIISVFMPISAPR
jgi:hypothetical protein